MTIAGYLADSLLNAGRIFAAGVLPLLAAALLFQLVSRSLCGSLILLIGVKPFIYLTAPGVAVHELSHAFFCIVFRHRINSMKLFSPEEDGTLGYVNHAYNSRSYYQRAGNFFIGTGPVWGGILVIFLLSKLLLPPEMLPFGESIPENLKAFCHGFSDAGLWKKWQFYLWLYLVLTIGSHINLSRPDLEGAAGGLLIVCGIILFSCTAFNWCGDWENRVFERLKTFFLGQFALTATVFCLLALPALVLKLIPFRKGVES